MTRTITDLLALREGLETGKYYADGTVVNLAFSKDDHMVVATTADEGFAVTIAALPELFDALERMRDALVDLLHVTDDPAGLSPETVADDAKFSVFLLENKLKMETAVAKARAALANRSEGDGL